MSAKESVMTAKETVMITITIEYIPQVLKQASLEASMDELFEKLQDAVVTNELKLYDATMNYEVLRKGPEEVWLGVR